MNQAELAAATAVHAAGYPRACSPGPRELIALDALAVLCRADKRLNENEKTACSSWRRRSLGKPVDCPVAWLADPAEIWERWRHGASMREMGRLYQALVGRAPVKSHRLDRLAAATLQVNAAAADFAARQAAR